MWLDIMVTESILNMYYCIWLKFPGFHDSTDNAPAQLNQDTCVPTLQCLGWGQLDFFFLNVHEDVLLPFQEPSSLLYNPPYCIKYADKCTYTLEKLSLSKRLNTLVKWDRFKFKKTAI